jgi:S-adenosylmethionine/arginine decarboxylase-like enzyme
MISLVHQHLVVSAEVARETVTSDELAGWLLSVVTRVGMRPITEPVVAYSDAPGNTGFLGILGISTSHLSIHHWDCCVPSLLQFDLYSCKAYDVASVLDEVNGFWSVRSGRIALLTRGHQYEPGLEIREREFFEALRG